MKNVLFVSIAFPPKNDPECLQTAKYFKYLVHNGQVNIDVVTSKNPTLFMPVDEKLRKYAKGYRQLVEVPIYENKYTNFLIRKISPDFLNQPELFRELLQPIIELEGALRAQAELDNINNKLFATVDEEVPDEYRDLVEEYYRVLSESQGSANQAQ